MIAVILGLILSANVFLVTRYRQGHITFPTDLLARMAGASFFISYIWYQYMHRRSLHLGFDTPVNILSWVNWLLIMGIFVFFVVAYLIRANPVVRAKGLRETCLPLWCGITPVLLLETHRLHFLPPEWIQIWGTALAWKLSACICLVTGHAITLVSFLYLGRAFSIMVQARHVVQHGPYRYIRHPIYVGETIAIIGIFLDVPSWINLAALSLWIIAQWFRARLEESKLAMTFESYREYRRKTGACFPKL